MTGRKNTYSIRQIIEITGATEFLLRTWETRYSSLVPKRTKTGRRRYSSDDVLKVGALMELTKRNYRIGKIANLPLAELQSLLNLKPVSPELKSQNLAVLKIINLANLYKWDEIRKIIEREMTRRSAAEAIHLFLLPLIGEMNKLVDGGFFTIAQEHIMTAFIKESLASLPMKSRRQSKPLRFVFASPEGDYHDVGLLIASQLTRCLGIKTLYLGANVPKRDLSETCLRYQATHLVLTSTGARANSVHEDLFEYVNFLDRNLDPSIHFWLGGPDPKCLGLLLQRPHKVLTSFEIFEKELKNM